MKKYQNPFRGMGSFLSLWSTQGLSALGSSMTSFALIVWSYQQSGQALTTAMLTVCTYAPYVLFSIFAGTFSDRWNKKYTMLLCDSFAAAGTVAVLILLSRQQLQVWHLYLINCLNGLMNTVQQPASEVAVSLLTPKEQYQRAGGLRSFSSSLVTMLAPVLATALYGLAGLKAVIFVDLAAYAVAFVTLALFIRIPSQETEKKREKTRGIIADIQEGLRYLQQNRGIFDLILFLAAINFVASMYQAALPAMLLTREGGSEGALGLVNACSGAANLAGSVMASLARPPKSRIRTICNCLLFAMSTENFVLAFGRSLPVWCVGAVLGWLFIPVMNANMDTLLRSYIPVNMQGRVYSARNSFQFFTIPLGYLVGGALLDKVFEPWMAAQAEGSFMQILFGSGKGSGAAALYFVLGVLGVLVCLYFRGNRHMRKLE